MASWWEDAYEGVMNWNVGTDQRNPDRGAQQDAFQMAMAEKGANYDITSRLMGDATQNEMTLAKQAAELDRRNTLDIMTAEHGQKLEGMEVSTKLQKDLMGTQYGYEIGTIKETGEQERAGFRTQGEEQRKGLVTAGEQERLNIGSRGTEERLTIGKTAEEQRATLAYDREHAAALATRYAKRA